MNSSNPEIDPVFIDRMSIINTNTDQEHPGIHGVGEQERLAAAEEAKEEARLVAQMNPRDRDLYLNAQFFNNLIDERFRYGDLLSQLAHQTYEATKIETGFHFVPVDLMDHLPPGDLNGSLSLSFDTDINDAFTLTKFEMELEDGPQIEIKTDWMSTALLVNGENVAMYLDPGLATTVLGCLLPSGVAATTPVELAKALHAQGGYQSHAMQFATEDTVFSFNSEETTKDSRHLFQVSVSLPEHASGKTIVLRVSITEGLLKAMNQGTSHGALDISVLPAFEQDDTQLYVEQIIGRKSVRVERLTEVHRKIISTALKELEELATKKRASAPVGN